MGRASSAAATAARSQAEPRRRVPRARRFQGRPQREEGHEEEEVVAGSDRLRRGHGRQRGRPRDRAGGRPAPGDVPRGEESQRHPLRREADEVRDVLPAEQRESVQQARAQSGSGIARLVARQQVHERGRQHERGHEHQVVREHHVPRDRVHGRAQQGLGQEVLGLGQRARRGMEDVRVPVRDRPGAAVRQAPRAVAPPQRPAAVQRVDQVAGDVAGRAGKQRPGEGHGGGRIEDDGGEERTPAHERRFYDRVSGAGQEDGYSAFQCGR